MENIERRGYPKIYAIAVDGAHRSGKGMQIEMLKDRFTAAGIPYVSIRGEGYRTGAGNDENNPESDYWTRMSVKLRERPDDYDSWNEASYRLARELIVWRDRVLKQKIHDALAPFGVLLIDRSLISNAMLKKLQIEPQDGTIFTPEELYPRRYQHRRAITADMVVPDLIIELVAPRDVLLSRLDENDPDYEFRKENIETKYDEYLNAKTHLPPDIQERIVTVDAFKEPEQVFADIVHEVETRFPELARSQEQDRK